MFSFSQTRKILQHLTDLPKRAAEISSDPLFLEVKGLTFIN